jgi:gliding motility-associated-like protein
VKYTINGFEQTGHQIDQSFEVGVTQVFWEVETSSGDFTAVTEVMVEDITDPVILSYGEDLDTCGLAVAYLPQSEFFDLCDSDLTIDTQVEGGQWNEELQVWNFTPGAHHVIYTASDDFGNQVVDSVLVTTNAINIPVYGVGDTSLAFVFEAQLGVLAVDDATSYSWSTNGPAVITGANTAFATVSELEFGINEFFITVNTPCGEGTDTVTVYVDDLSVPSGFSPNGDGQNDEFVIRGIENLAPNDFTVYNRWGVKVYESKDYQNDWNGTARNGNALPADTYYFILNLPDRNPYKAYIELKR